MRNDKLRAVFAGLGFDGVVSVLSSGNLVFATDDDASTLEDRIQRALQDELGIGGGTIIRSRDELQALVDTDPFAGREHGRESYLTATFLKYPSELAESLAELDGASVSLVGYDRAARAVLAVSDHTTSSGPEFMTTLERRFGKDITTRTWLTVTRILARFPN
ncbi:hypothetical protein BJF85_13715 [Saccharomonospora sp. CUA-673]|nr:hypothetical protein BJF85_13715 [Saccharomonospora sp. CUA-673]